VQLWKGPRTPSESYFVHWGLFLFVFISWMVWETREWMAATPLSALRRLEPYKPIIQGGLVLLAFAALGLVVLGVHIAWIVLPLAVWAGLLLLRPGAGEARQAALFLFGTALAITFMVEIVVVKGDVGRMNTVFKFYLQAWTLLAVAGAAALGWMVADFSRWSPRWRMVWQVPFVFLLVSAALFTFLGSMAKIRDRMVPEAPFTLDGMKYMEFATYDNLGTPLDLNQDYHAIRWMQENVQGSPVIVEATSPNQYAWFSRFSIYTGLPSVRGWEWHQIQQRILAPGAPVHRRGGEVETFYQTIDLESAAAFLKKYNVQYIIVGQVERGYYAYPGIGKFPAGEGLYWRTVYEDRDTVIYEVIQPEF
jgi:uncharacterized membrane protein